MNHLGEAAKAIVSGGDGCANAVWPGFGDRKAKSIIVFSIAEIEILS